MSSQMDLVWRESDLNNRNGFRLVQRKFAQGVPIPASNTSVAPPPQEKKPDAPYSPRHVYHNNMSAREILDVVAMQSIHKHKQPMVLLERLRDDEIPPPSVPKIALKKRNNMCLRSGKRKAPEAGKGPSRKRKKLSSESTDDLPLLYYFSKLNDPKPQSQKLKAVSDKEERAGRPMPKRGRRLETVTRRGSDRSVNTRLSSTDRSDDSSGFTFKEPSGPVRRLFKRKAVTTAVIAGRPLRKAVIPTLDSRRSGLRSSATRGIARRLRGKRLSVKKLPKPVFRKPVQKTIVKEVPPPSPQLSTSGENGHPQTKPNTKPAPAASESETTPFTASERDSMSRAPCPLSCFDPNISNSCDACFPNVESQPDWCIDNNIPKTPSETENELINEADIDIKEETLNAGEQNEMTDSEAACLRALNICERAVLACLTTQRNTDLESLLAYNSGIARESESEQTLTDVNDTVSTIEPEVTVEQSNEEKPEEMPPNTQGSIDENMARTRRAEENNEDTQSQTDEQTLLDLKMKKERNLAQKKKNKTGPKPKKAKEPVVKSPRAAKNAQPKRATKNGPEENPTRILRHVRETPQPPAPANPDVYEFDAELETSRPPSGLRARRQTKPPTPKPPTPQPSTSKSLTPKPPAPQPSTSRALTPTPSTSKEPEPQPSTSKEPTPSTSQAPALAPSTSEAPTPTPSTSQAPALAPSTSEAPTPAPSTSQAHTLAPSTSEAPTPTPQSSTSTQGSVPTQTQGPLNPLAARLAEEKELFLDVFPGSPHCIQITPKQAAYVETNCLNVCIVKKEVCTRQRKHLIGSSQLLLDKLLSNLSVELHMQLESLISSAQNRNSETAPAGEASTSASSSSTTYLDQNAGSVLDAPTFYPTAEEFADPIKYYDKIAPEASKFGLCKIVPPEDFKPPCNMSQAIRFAVIYQYISKMYSRWGPVSRELAAIKAHLRTQSVVFARSPLLDGSEVNLPKLYHAVERNGGLSNVIRRKRWGRVADEMKLTKLQHPERKLDPIYMRYLLPYATLSDQERQNIMAEVESCWTTKYQKMLERARNPFQRQNRMLGTDGESSDDDAEDGNTVGALQEAEDCIVPGRIMNVATFKKIATSLMDAHFEPNKQPPSAVEVEKAYWRAVLLGTEHIVANTASIDTGEEGYGFPKDPEAEYGTHPWNLKVLARNPHNVLRYLGAALGVTVPTLHLGMLFSTSCWHRDPHGLPWTEYMHSGKEKIWYGIPRDESSNFRRAVETLCPAYCQNKSIWLASEITMVPPNILSEHGVKLSRLLQKPGEYVFVFPEAYSCSITTGFTISESVYFASNTWLTSVYKLFQELRNSCEPTMFSLEQLLLNGSQDPEAPQHVASVLATLLGSELEHRRALEVKGLKVQERPPANAPLNTSYFRAWNERDQDECEYCRSTLFLSKVIGLTGRNSALCPEHAIRLLETKKHKNVDVYSLEFVSSHSTSALEEMLERLETRIPEEVIDLDPNDEQVIDLTGPEPLPVASGSSTV